MHHAQISPALTMAHNVHFSSIVDMKKHPTIRDVITKGKRHNAEGTE
jgi:hypothetical protein